MKVNVKSIDNKDAGSVKLPEQFSQDVRVDLVRRAVLAKQSHDRQAYGADPMAGKRASAYVSKRRNSYKSTYGIGQSRTPRKVMNFRGQRFSWTGAFAPQTVGGRRAHPPKAEKEFSLKINKKERLKAICSALSATVQKDVVSLRGHAVPDSYPFVLDDACATLNKTKDVIAMLGALGFSDELERASERKIRPGKGKMRGRRYRSKKSVLFVVDKECPLMTAASNILGIEVALVDHLNAELLAPGGDVGRATLFTKAAVEKLASDNLFVPKVSVKAIAKASAAKPSEVKA